LGALHAPPHCRDRTGAFIRLVQRIRQRQAAARAAIIASPAFRLWRDGTGRALRAEAAATATIIIVVEGAGARRVGEARTRSWAG
jgi:hypothetical protein